MKRSKAMVGQRSFKSATCRLNYSLGVPQEMRDGLREVSHVEAAEQGQGHGTGLMQQVCQEADRSRFVLLLTAKPELKAWYESFGFYQLPDSEGVMARPIQTTQQGIINGRREASN